MSRTHQPGEAVFRSILPETIDWQPFPAFPPEVRLAVLVGYPSEPGPYVIRVKAFHWAKSGEYITQVTAIGPLGLEYVYMKDDPRKVSASL